MAPEVYDSSKYDPQPVDIWSLAIVYACMSLRRFPWKAPRLTDNSYKLFVSPPNKGTPYAEPEARRSSDGRVKSAPEIRAAADVPYQASAPNTDATARPQAEPNHDHHDQGHHHRHEENSHIADGSHSVPTPGPRVDAPSAKSETIKGPWRLLRLLPRETRLIMGKMLEVDPKARATLEDMMKDPWITNTPVCSQIEGGKIIKAPGHEHTLEPGAPAVPA